MHIIVSFSDDPVTFWDGSGWQRGSANALKMTSKPAALAAWQVLIADTSRDVWLVKDWGKMSERTIATREYGILHP